MPAGLAQRAEALLARHWWRPQPSALSRLLQPLAALYGALLHRARARTPVAAALPVPVLVVGNVIAGGAGKTPTVIALVQALQAAGHRPGVVSRGHGRQGEGLHEVAPDDSASRSGDEPLLICRRCAVPVVVGRQRAEAARSLCAAHPEVDVIVADDGLQHLALPRQAELLVFDERGIGNGLLLPAGPLREPLAPPGPRRRVLHTGGPGAGTPPGPLATRRLGLAWPLAAWCRGDAGAARPLASLRGRPLLAAAGLAAPQKFFAMLRDEGLQPSELPLPDHFDYATLPWPTGTPEVLVTEKDAVKIDPSTLGDTAVWVLPLDFSLPAGLVPDLIALLFPSPAGAPGAPLP